MCNTMLFQDTSDGLFFSSDKCFIGTILSVLSPYSMPPINPLELEKDDILELKVVSQSLLGTTCTGIVNVVFKYYDPTNNVIFCRIDVWSLK